MCTTSALQPVLFSPVERKWAFLSALVFVLVSNSIALFRYRKITHPYQAGKLDCRVDFDATEACSSTVGQPVTLGGLLRGALAGANLVNSLPLSHINII
jgi:hypothetical protein